MKANPSGEAPCVASWGRQPDADWRGIGEELGVPPSPLPPGGEGARVGGGHGTALAPVPQGPMVTVMGQDAPGGM